MLNLFDMTKNDFDEQDQKTVSKTIMNGATVIHVTIKKEDPPSNSSKDSSPEPTIKTCGVLGRYGLIFDQSCDEHADSFCPFESIPNQTRDSRRTNYFENQIRLLEERRKQRRRDLSRLFSQVSTAAQEIATLREAVFEERAMQRPCQIEEVENVAEAGSSGSDPSIWERLDVSNVNEEMD